MRGPYRRYFADVNREVLGLGSLQPDCRDSKPRLCYTHFSPWFGSIFRR